MTAHSDHAETLITWYANEARPFLVETAKDRIVQLDQEVDRFETLRKTLTADLPVCFLGTAGVGKSTLINAVVAGRDVVLPAGGVGPLTAEATVVRYAQQRHFRVEYHPPTKLNKLLFALERAHENELRKRGESVTVSELPGADILTAEDRYSAELALESDTDPVSPRPSQIPDILGALARQAVHLIRGEQYASLDREYTLDRLRDCLGTERRFKTEPLPEDLERLVRIKEVLQRARSGEGAYELSAITNDAAFRHELQLHAAGHLAPLVRNIEVGWDTEMLAEGVVLVDLPGLGVANDEFRRVTAHWIRRSRGVVLVVDRSGMSEASADLLRTSGFLNSLLHESNDTESQNATLIVAVVKLDATADDARVQEKLMNPSKARPWAVHFEEACQRAEEMIRDQLAIELQKVAEQGGESTRDERAVVIRRVLEGLQVHPVVAPEYRKLLTADEDEPPRIKNVEQSRIPALTRSLAELVHERNARSDARIELFARNMSERLRGVLELTQARAEQESTLHTERTERVRKELEQFAEPLRLEIVNKQGEFREFLRSTIPREIDARVDAAAADARSDITKHLRRYRNYHWSTLRAAIRRGGVYEGARNVDLPADLALMFEDPIAVLWAKHILSELRSRTSGIGKEYVSILGELVEWARKRGDTVDSKVLEALQRELQGEMEGLASVGREAVDELKALVKGELYEALEKGIREHCRRFVASGEDRGSGVMTRMQRMLDELPKVVSDAARPVAREVLNRRYQQVEAEIRTTFDKYRNPVDGAMKELLGGARATAQRDQLERPRVIAKRAKTLIASIPAERSLGVDSREPS